MTQLQTKVRTIGAAMFVLMIIAQPGTVASQARSTQPHTQPQTQPPPQKTQPPPQTQPTPQTQPQRGQRAAPKPPTPMTLRQVLESLSATKSSSRVEDQISKAGVQFRS